MSKSAAAGGCGIKSFLIVATTILVLGGIGIGVAYAVGAFNPKTIGEPAVFAVEGLQKLIASGRRRELGVISNETNPLTDPIPLSGSFSYAVVDSLKLKIRSVQMSAANSNSDTIWSADGGEQVVEIGKAGFLNINSSCSIPRNKTYLQADALFKQQFTIQAYCQTETKVVYTTASMIKTIDRVAPTANPTPIPNDYAPFTYNFGYVTTATSVNGATGNMYEQTMMNYTIAPGEAVALKVFIDSTYIVSCYDGVDPITTNPLPPFTWGNNNNIPRTDFFPNLSPNFGLSYIPLFIYIGPANETNGPGAKTYKSSNSLPAVSSSQIDFQQAQIHTMLFNGADNKVLAARTRGFSSNYLQQFYGAFSGVSPTYSAFNGEVWSAVVNTQGRIVNDRILTFTDDDIGVQTIATISNGTECCNQCTNSSSECLIDYQFNPSGCRNRQCLYGGTQSLFWYQIDRIV